MLRRVVCSWPHSVRPCPASSSSNTAGVRITCGASGRSEAGAHSPARGVVVRSRRRRALARVCGGEGQDGHGRWRADVTAATVTARCAPAASSAARRRSRAGRLCIFSPRRCERLLPSPPQGGGAVRRRRHRRVYPRASAGDADAVRRYARGGAGAGHTRRLRSARSATQRPGTPAAAAVRAGGPPPPGPGVGRPPQQARPPYAPCCYRRRRGPGNAEPRPPETLFALERWS